MSDNQYLEKKWYSYLKKKYNLNDDDMAEYIDSFNLINKGNIVTANILANFVNDESNNHLAVDEMKSIISEINVDVGNKAIKTLDLKTYLLYIIPICQEYAVTRIGIRKLFDDLDSNKDGKITCKELIGILYKINKNLTPDEIANYKKEIKKACLTADTNHDGYISYSEFKAFMINNGISLNKYNNQNSSIDSDKQVESSK
jgi:Ca2+-binding EF-hand superfamily protein